MSPDELGSEVNRLYWETAEPVTRLADQLGVSRGTFYNHLDPLPAGGRCSVCGGALAFRTRSDRDSGAAHCGSCGREQTTGAREPARRTTPPRPRDARALRVERNAADTPIAAQHTREAELLGARASWLESPHDAEDRMRTRLLIVAVGAAVLGLGILFYSRRR